jgi:predicted O-methyltransferase YrrM
MFSSLSSKPLRAYEPDKTNLSIARLTSHKNPKIRAIGEALLEAYSLDFLPEELEWVNSIEQRRSTLLQSSEEITVLDYGAGDAHSNRTQEEMREGVKFTKRVATVCEWSKPKPWAIVLFKLIRKLKPSSCVELGTCVGISASYQAGALKMNGSGKLLTLEGSPETARIARETFAHLDLRNASVVVGPFHDTLQNALQSAKPIDFFFNDGHHDYTAVKRYFEESLPHLASDSVIIFDDISWSPGMRKAWAEVENDERVYASIDMQAMGIALVGKKLMPKEKFTIELT